MTSPAASGTAFSIAATQLLIATASPPRLKTRAPSGWERLASSSVLATSAAYWNSVDPPNVTSYALAQHGGGDGDGRAARHPLVAPDAVYGQRPEADARNAGVPPVNPGAPLVCQLVHAVVVARVRDGVLLEAAGRGVDVRWRVHPDRSR